MRPRPTSLAASLFFALVSLLAGSPASAAQPPRAPPQRPLLQPNADPGMQCRQAISTAERAAGVPSQLMAAIGRIESGRVNGQGTVHPWPWTINAEGEGHYYDSKAEAIAAVRALQARGVRSVDVGCMQVNLMFHPDAFDSLEDAFDPLLNAHYAARFLNTLYAQTGTWVRATANYHSATPELGDDYQRKVAAVLPDELRKLGFNAYLPAGGANVWSTNAFTSNMWNSGGTRASRAPAGPRLPPAPTMLAHGPVQGGGTMLSNRAENARIIAAPAGAAGRGLDAYRAAPIPVASIPIASLAAGRSRL